MLGSAHQNADSQHESTSKGWDTLGGDAPTVVGHLLGDFDMTRNARFFFVTSLALLLTACGDDSDDGDTAATATATATESGTDSASASASASASDSNTAGETASATATETATTGDGTTTNDDSATSAGETTGEATTTASTGEGDSSGNTSIDACEPEGDDDECSMCLKTSCCDQLQACRDDADCDCIITCLDKLGTGIEGLDQCQTQCDAKFLPPTAIPLQMCQTTMCEACG